MGFFGMNKNKAQPTATETEETGKPVKVSVVAAGREPVTVEGADNWTVEDFLIEAGIDANQVTVDGKEAELSDSVSQGTKRIVAVPNVKGGSLCG